MFLSCCQLECNCPKTTFLLDGYLGFYQCLGICPGTCIFSQLVAIDFAFYSMQNAYTLCMHLTQVFFALYTFMIFLSATVVLYSPVLLISNRSYTYAVRHIKIRLPFTMGPVTFSDITTAIAFISILGLIMTYDQITLIKQRLNALHSRLSGAIRHAEAAEAEARLATEKYGTSRKRIAMLEEKLNDYQRALMDEVAAITQRQDLNTAVVRRGGEKCHQGSLSRQLYEVPTSSSRKTDTLSYISRRTTRATILAKDAFSSQHQAQQQHRGVPVPAVSGVAADFVLGEMSPPPHRGVLAREKSESGKNSVRSAFANISLKVPWRLRTKEATAAVKRRMASFHL
ncbi:hypothetical protein, variant 2 [Blastomyces gilchristii SLH14081]|uniref:Uncharacterized protein n=1 Tax=Blastomyces gilchristii (strain SLH14081) TaxID=559298 RepID=A0A179U6W8_BLAGS|nr:hypothetical protein, variant 2 [Blastomyces gilchristii SLH14081]XP_031575803.1 uncharacterized protein BDBG_00462 [Blastomyces gilchristii SLH14081]XP_031575804.1 hypothetical protein, variant 1 [Blastomyces gilchristii SLH14081]OAT03774.1 hypothetical protein BDBG_00462 [Blastomyces gilchristii SLH14081]OAT03775.1 hypothetical protein, variant 1 [Blastomyces gilchristii SLH14081]OAT03776.1 hypothetical protein, variant 2 [Blastomyces gilchristii SLH14081]